MSVSSRDMNTVRSINENFESMIFKIIVVSRDTNDSEI